MNIEITLDEGVAMPEYATCGSVGFDLINHKFLALFENDKEIEIGWHLTRDLKDSLFLQPRHRILIGTGIKMKVSDGYEMQIRSRSGSTLKRGLVVANGVGTIDCDYRDEIGIIIINTTNEPVLIQLGESLAQGVISPICRTEFKEVKELPKAKERKGGFGSTNKK